MLNVKQILEEMDVTKTKREKHQQGRESVDMIILPPKCHKFNIMSAFVKSHVD